MKKLKIKALFILCLIFTLCNVSIIEAKSHTVYLDAGHGGSDSGAISLEQQQAEKVWNLETMTACKKILEENGVRVNFTRQNDIYVDLHKRSEMANNSNSECFVSIHYNASDNHKGRYGVVIPNKVNDSTKLANCIKEQLTNIRNDVKVWDNTNYYSVLRRTKIPSVIIEACFIDNESDVKYANSLEKRGKIGKYIAYGIMDYLKVDYKIEKKTKNKRVDKVSNITATVMTKNNKNKNSILNRIKNKNNSSSERERMNYIKNLLNK